MEENQIEFQIEEENSTCPACGTEMIIDQKECYSCGIVLNPYEKVQFERNLKESIGGLDHLNADKFKALDLLWKKLVVNYHDTQAHHNFMRKCFAEKALPYAVHCYTRMLEIDSEDDIANLMRRQALSMVSVNYQKEKGDSPGAGTEVVERYPILKWINWVGLFSSSFCIVAGMLTPGAQNLIGLGFSFLIIFLGLYIFRTRK